MQPKAIAIAAVALILILAIYWIFSGESEQDAIAKRLDQLVETLENSAGGGQIQALAGGNKAASFFTEDCIVEAPNVRITVDDKDSLTGSFAQALTMCETVNIQLNRRDITLSQDARSATMNLRASFTVTVSGRKESGSGEYQLDWIKYQGKWYIQSVLMLR